MGDAEKPQGSVSDTKVVTKQTASSEELVAMMSKPNLDQQASAEREPGAEAGTSDPPAGTFGPNEAASAVRGTRSGPLGGSGAPPMSALGIAPLGATGTGGRFGASPMQALGIAPIGSVPSSLSSKIPPPTAYVAPPPVVAPPASHSPEEAPPDSGWGTDRPSVNSELEERPLQNASALSSFGTTEHQPSENWAAPESERSVSQEIDNEAITEIDPSGGFFQRGTGSEPPESARISPPVTHQLGPTTEASGSEASGSNVEEIAPSAVDASGSAMEASARTEETGADRSDASGSTVEEIAPSATDASVEVLGTSASGESGEAVVTANTSSRASAPTALADGTEPTPTSDASAPDVRPDEIPPSAIDASGAAMQDHVPAAAIDASAPEVKVDEIPPSAIDASGAAMQDHVPATAIDASAPSASMATDVPSASEPSAAMHEQATTAMDSAAVVATHAPGMTTGTAEVCAHVPIPNPSWKGGESPGFDDVTVVTPPKVFGAHSEPTLVGAKVVPEFLVDAAPSPAEDLPVVRSTEGAIAPPLPDVMSSEDAEAASSKPTQIRRHPAPDLVVSGLVGSAADLADDQAPPPGRSLHSKPAPKPIGYHSVEMPASAGSPAGPMATASEAPAPSASGFSLKTKLLGSLWIATIAGATVLGWYAAGASNEKKLAAASASATSAIRAAREAGAAEARAAIPPVPALLDLDVPPGSKSASEILKTEIAKRTRLDAVALGRQWQSKRFDEFNRFSADLRHSPQRLDDVKVRLSAMEFVNDRLTSRAALELLAELATPRALDVLYAVWTGSKERTETTQLAEALLFAEDVRPRVSEPLELALALREKPTSCSEIQRIVAKAIREGDRRSANLLVTTAARKNCGEAGNQDCIKCLEDVKDMRKAIRAAAVRPEPVP